MEGKLKTGDLISKVFQHRGTLRDEVIQGLAKIRLLCLLMPVGYCERDVELIMSEASEECRKLYTLIEPSGDAIYDIKIQDDSLNI